MVIEYTYKLLALGFEGRRTPEVLYKQYCMTLPIFCRAFSEDLHVEGDDKCACANIWECKYQSNLWFPKKRLRKRIFVQQRVHRYPTVLEAL